LFIIASTGSAQRGEAIGIVAEDLDLDRLGVAFEIAQHVLQQLDELDLDERRGSWTCSRTSLMISSDERLRCRAA
jgi:hypothetical protein